MFAKQKQMSRANTLSDVISGLQKENLGSYSVSCG